MNYGPNIPDSGGVRRDISKRVVDGIEPGGRDCHVQHPGDLANGSPAAPTDDRSTIPAGARSAETSRLMRRSDVGI